MSRISSQSTNPDYPKIDWRFIRIPDAVKNSVRLNGNFWLIKSDAGADVYNQLKFWVVWKDKKCIKCGNEFKLHLVIVPGDSFNDDWDYARMLPSGAFPTCEHIEDAQTFQSFIKPINDFYRERLKSQYKKVS